MVTATVDKEIEQYRDTYCKDCVSMIYCRSNNKFCNKLIVDLAEDKYREGYEAPREPMR